MFVNAEKNFWIEDAVLSPSAQIPPHVHHDTWELNFTMRGKGVRTLGNSTEPFACGDVVLTPPRVKHFWDFRPWKRKFRTYCVFIRERWIDELQRVIPPLENDFAPLLRTPVSIVARGSLRTKARKILESLGSRGESEQSLDVIGLLLLFSRASEEAVRIRHSAVLSPDERAREDLRLYFVCNYTRQIRLGDAAREFGKSRSGFCDYVKRVTGKTLGECLMETRMEKACELLATTTASVAEIAVRVGIEDAAYFSRIFSRHVGMSPLRWRRQACLNSTSPLRGFQ